MKTKYLLVVILIGLVLNAAGQSSEARRQNSYATFNFISPFVGITPRWKAGYYAPIANNVYLGAELGIGSSFISPEARIKLGRRYNIQNDYRSLEIGPELIYMVSRKHFISAKYSHLSHSASLENGTILSQPDELYYDFTSLDYERTVSSFHIFYGYMDEISKRLGFMLKIGLGGREKTVTLSNVRGRVLSSNPQASGFASTNDGSVESFPIAFDLKIYYNFN